ncbi:acetyltransferase, partial [Mycobacterium tuberculosis]
MTKPTSAGQADDALVRLARERFDLPDQVRRLARPPVPSLEPPYG